MSCSSDNVTGNGACHGTDALLPIDPFSALEVHFGMLLGVDDIDALAANPRGKLRLHNAWLHREGVIWGLGLELRAAQGELAVNPGLAVDALGHELHLDTAACVNLGAWYRAHKADADFAVTTTGTQVKFDAHVVLRFKACLTRPVPAIADSCENTGTDTAYSRAYETVEILLRPNLSKPKEQPYHRLRLLFGLDEPRSVNGSVTPEDAAIVNRRTDIRQNHPLDDQPKLYLEAFREYAAKDTIDLAAPVDGDGARSLFPESDPSELLLGDVQGIVLNQGGDGSFSLGVPAPTLTTSVRPSHVATATIQELLCGPVLGAGATSGSGPSAPLDAGGPRFIPSTVALSGKTVTLSSTLPLALASVEKEAFALTTYDDTHGWAHVDIKTVTLDAGATNVALELKEDAGGDLFRLVASGTGSAPILGALPNFIPLAGAVGGPPGSVMNGNDFTHMWKRS